MSPSARNTLFVLRSGTMSCFPNKQGGGATSSPLTIYEFLIDQTTDDPASMISYTGANKDFIPAKMNFATGKFEYGSWRNAWIFDKFKPCMLHANGTVAYYLNPYNLTQKITGGDAMGDLTSTEHDMNAMVEVGQIWIKEEVIDDDHFHIYLSPTKHDGFDCWTHYNANNKLLDNYYVAMFKGSLDSNNKIRSLSGQEPQHGLNGKAQKQYAQANGSGWDCDEWCFRRLMQYLLCLLGKSTNTQSVFGNGFTSSENKAPLTTGGTECYGSFWGENEGKNHVKIFGIEDHWGNVYSLYNGYLNFDENFYVKMTPGTVDGSTGSSYSEETSDYVAIAKEPGLTEGRIKKMKLIAGKGLFPTDLSGTDTTYYCDYAYAQTPEGENNDGLPAWARFGGMWTRLLDAGSFYVANNNSNQKDVGSYGVNVTYKSPN